MTMPKIPRNIRIESVPTNDPEKTITTEIYFDEGGRSILSGDYKPRGYRLAAKLTKQSGGLATYTPTDSGCALIEEATRFSPKKLGELAKTIKSHPRYRPLIQTTLAKNNLQLA